jgi:hypothetical protein
LRGKEAGPSLLGVRGDLCAVQRLREAIKKGYRDLDYLKTDEHLDVLRRRDDFQKLLNE